LILLSSMNDLNILNNKRKTLLNYLTVINFIIYILFFFNFI